MCEVRMLLRRYTLVNGKEKTIMKLSKILLMLCVVAIVGVAVLTAVQTVYAYSPVPPGCQLTYHDAGCKRCGILWLYKKYFETWKWVCPNGGGGNYTSYGICYNCAH